MKMRTIFSFSVLCVLQFSCDKDSEVPQQYRYMETITIDGLQRSYTIQLPRNYYNDSLDIPVVIGLHGTGGSGTQFENDYAFSTRSAEEGYIAVYPDGIQKQDGRLKIRTWNAGSCCDYAMHNNVNDVKFINSIIDQMSAKFHVDVKKIYLAGMSNGAMMAYRFAAEMPGKIAAVAAVSGTMVYEKNIAQHGVVPFLHIHSLRDTKVPFAGGKGLQDYQFPPVMEGIYYWARRNGCDTNASVQNFNGYELRSWQNTAGDTLIKCYLTQDGGHAWPGSTVQRRFGDEPSEAIDANELIWNFFSRFVLP